MAAEKNKTADAQSNSDFVITRIFNAPPALVFKAWTDPAHLARWWGPHNFTNPVCQMDVRPGGAYRIVMRSPDGVDYPLTGIFREIMPPERIVMTMDCSGHPKEWHDQIKPNRSPGDTNPAGELLTTVTFKNMAGKTEMTVRTRFESTEIGKTMMKMGMTEGWSQSLERLEDLLKKI
jgi:uncharacterized protein YndB with AHSA1/START domain